MLERLSGERPRKIIEVECCEAIERRAAAESRDMRRDDYALVAPERMGCRQWLFFEDISRHTGQMAAVEGGDERRGIDETATSDIDDAGTPR